MLRCMTGMCFLALLTALVWCFFHFAVDVPVWDQWGIIYLFDEYYAGNIDFSDFYKPHNEHRLLFPKMIMLGLGVLTKYNVLYEMGLSVLLACCILGLLMFHVASRHAILRLGNRRFVLYLGLIVLVLSLRQHENWFWGFQLQWYLNVLAVCGSLFLLTRDPRPRDHSKHRPGAWGAWLAAASCGVVATFSLASGLLVWPLGLLCLILTPRKNVSRTLLALSWICLAGLVAYLYFHGLNSGAKPSMLMENIGAPLDVGAYVLFYLASPFTLWGHLGPLELTLGALCLAMLLLETVRVLRLPPDARQAALFFLLLGYYALGTAFLTGAGRLNLGMIRAASSRYVTIAQLAWLPALQFALCAPPRLARGGSVLKATGLALAGILLCFSLLRGYQSLPYMQYAWRVYSYGRWALQYKPSDEALGKIAWSPKELREYAIPVLRKHGLSVFRR